MNAATSSHGAKFGRLLADLARLRLPPSEIMELRYFFNEFEADIGIHSLHFAQFDALLGFRGTAHPWHEPEVEPHACMARKRAHRVFHALQRMLKQGEALHVTVLYRMYGPRPPGVRWEVFRDLAPIAEHTPAVGALAERMTRMLQMQIRSRAIESLGPLDSFARERVVTGIHESVSRREAMVARLDRRPVRKASMTQAEFARARQEVKGAREEFVRTVMREADQLLVAASHAYRSAKSRMDS